MSYQLEEGGIIAREVEVNIIFVNLFTSFFTTRRTCFVETEIESIISSYRTPL